MDFASSKEFDEIIQLLVHSGFNASLYKKSFLKRRITAALRRSNAKTPEDYVKLLHQEPKHLDDLRKSFSINVTHFFRNLDSFQQLENVFLPAIIKDKEQKKKEMIKVWSVGCANGAEPYSLAIIFFRLLGSSQAKKNVKLLATDYNSNLLEIAKKGEYRKASLKEVPSSIIHKFFFEQSPDLFHIDSRIKQMVDFQIHDILKDQPPKNLDLIVCRNLLIYLATGYQTQIFQSFADSLNKDGLLVLGRTEIIPFQFRSKYQILDNKHRVYQKRG